MKRTKLFLLVLLVLVVTASPLFAVERSGFGLDVLVDGEERREYSARGTVYVEAIPETGYALRVTNPLPHRVAVALSVDGLNTLNAKHSSARSAAKWIIEPYGSIVISGWQVNDRAAREFFFTGEKNSYGAALGQTENLGVIEAVFFRERVRTWYGDGDVEKQDRPRPESRDKAEAPSAGSSRSGISKKPQSAEEGKLSDDYAATGMGDRRHHSVQRVHLDLESEPAASIRIRYEFRPQLVKLGVFRPSRAPLERREQARGFEPWCPEVE